MSSENPRSEPPTVPWPDIVKFVRQLGHDIRNNLNAVELQSAYLAELANELEIKGEVSRLREMISEIEYESAKVDRETQPDEPHGYSLFGRGFH